MFCNFLDIPGGVQCSRCEHKQRRRTLRNCDLTPKAQQAMTATNPATPRVKGPKGPGDYLHDLIVAWVSQRVAQGCGCENHIRQMNAWGTQGCRTHLDEIIDWLLAEAKKRGWWKYAAALPGSRFAIRWMVLVAIENAEKPTML